MRAAIIIGCITAPQRRSCQSRPLALRLARPECARALHLLRVTVTRHHEGVRYPVRIRVGGGAAVLKVAITLGSN